MFPANKRPLNMVTNHRDECIPINRLTIAYRRALNFDDLFLERKIQKTAGPSVSSFLNG
jgi:hypothetical protein